MPEEAGKANLLLRGVSKGVDFIIIATMINLIPQVGFLGGLTYLLISDGLFESRSAGKKILRLRVVSASSGAPATFRDSIIRNAPLAAGLLLLKVPLLGWFFLMAVIALEGLLILGNRDGMRLGDDLANTKVVEG